MSEMIVIKIGGVASQQLTDGVLAQLLAWKKEGKNLVIVHGGGFAINQLMEEEQVSVQKINGLRVTSQSGMKLVYKALVERVGTNLKASLTRIGLDVFQLTEELQAVVEADFLDQNTYGYVGDVTAIKKDALERALENGQTPLLASIGYSKAGEALNINADYLATAVAQTLQADQLILMTDVPGVLEDGQVLKKLPLEDVADKINRGIISGGMIPKIESAAKTVESGVGQVLITDNLTTGTVICK